MARIAHEGMLLAGILLAVFSCMLGGARARAQSAAPLDRIASVFSRIETLYVEQVDMAPLVEAAVTAVRRGSGRTDAAWTSCLAGQAAARPGAHDLQPLADAFACAGPMRNDPARLERIADDAIQAAVAKLDDRSQWYSAEAMAELTGRTPASGIDDSLAMDRRDTVLILRLKSLPAGVARRLEDGIRAQGRGARAIVLDLRDNPGGLLEEAVAVADLFLDHGTIVTMRGRLPTDIAVHRAARGQVAPKLPIIALVNGQTAAGAEIIAAALQDNKRAIVIGQRSHGLGSVQTLFQTDGNHALKLTTAHGYRPNGRRLSDDPVMPDCQNDLDPVALMEEATTFVAMGAAPCSAATLPIP